jgi:NAD(P)-dependent dehydrogenase (short-subunit alcohol dehydrogenase family)
MLYTALPRYLNTGGKAAVSGPRPLGMDLTSDDSVTAGAGEVLRNEGRIDILVHAAGDGLRQMDANYLGAPAF